MKYITGKLITGPPFYNWNFTLEDPFPSTIIKLYFIPAPNPKWFDENHNSYAPEREWTAILYKIAR